MQRFVSYYARAQAPDFVSSAAWSLLGVCLMNVNATSGNGLQERENPAMHAPWFRVYSAGRLRYDSRRSKTAKSGLAEGVATRKAPEGLEGGIFMRIEPGECNFLRQEVKIEVFDHESTGGVTGDRRVCSVWQHMCYMPPTEEGASFSTQLERDQLDAPASFLPPNFQLGLQWLRREGGGKGGSGVVHGSRHLNSMHTSPPPQTGAGVSEESILHQGLGSKPPPTSSGGGRLPSGAYARLPSADASLDRLKAAQTQNGTPGSRTPQSAGGSSHSGRGGGGRQGQVAVPFDKTGSNRQPESRQDSFRSELLATGPTSVALSRLPIREELTATSFDIAAELGHSNVQSAQRQLNLDPVRTSNDATHAGAPVPETFREPSRRADGAISHNRKPGAADIVTPPRR